MAVSDDLAAAIEQLRDHQLQLDMDGIMVGVSRQALDEVLASAARLRETGAGRVRAKHSSYLPLPMSTAPKDATLLRLLVRFDSRNDNHHPLEDSYEPQWTMGTNHLSNTGEDEWLIVGWNWTHDCFTTSGGEPLGWLPLVPPQPDGCGLPCGYDCNGACSSTLTQPQADEVTDALLALDLIREAAKDSSPYGRSDRMVTANIRKILAALQTKSQPEGGE